MSAIRIIKTVFDIVDEWKSRRAKRRAADNAAEYAESIKMKREAERLRAISRLGRSWWRRRVPNGQLPDGLLIPEDYDEEDRSL